MAILVGGDGVQSRQLDVGKAMCMRQRIQLLVQIALDRSQLQFAGRRRARGWRTQVDERDRSGSGAQLADGRYEFASDPTDMLNVSGRIMIRSVADPVLHA